MIYIYIYDILVMTAILTTICSSPSRADIPCGTGSSSAREFTYYGGGKNPWEAARPSSAKGGKIHRTQVGYCWLIMGNKIYG